MSASKFAPPLYNGRGLENQLLNTICGTHDLCCGCPTPLKHIQDILKCHLTEETTTTATKEEDAPTPEDGFEPGDLETLFASDFEEEDDDTR